MQNGEPQVYTSLATLRNAQVQLQWSFFQLFFVFNAAALSVALGVNQIDQILKLILSMVSFLAQLGFFFASWRAIEWLDYYDEKLATLERYDRDTSGASQLRIEVFSDYEFKNREGTKMARRGYLLPFGMGIGAWLWLSCYHLVLYLLAIVK